jgi:hypothetical protein
MPPELTLCDAISIVARLYQDGGKINVPPGDIHRAVHLLAETREVDVTEAAGELARFARELAS